MKVLLDSNAYSLLMRGQGLGGQVTAFCYS